MLRNRLFVQQPVERRLVRDLPRFPPGSVPRRRTGRGIRKGSDRPVPVPCPLPRPVEWNLPPGSSCAQVRRQERRSRQVARRPEEPHGRVHQRPCVATHDEDDHRPVRAVAVRPDQGVRRSGHRPLDQVSPYHRPHLRRRGADPRGSGPIVGGSAEPQEDHGILRAEAQHGGDGGDECGGVVTQIDVRASLRSAGGNRWGGVPVVRCVRHGVIIPYRESSTVRSERISAGACG